MAKDYQKGDCYKLFINTGTIGSPTFAELKSVDDLGLDFQIGDIEVPERGSPKGHFTGQGDPMITFTLMEDIADANVTHIIDTLHGSMTACAEEVIILALARDDIGTDGTVTTGGGVAGTIWYEMECVLSGSLSANQGDVASYDVEARRWANSDFGLEQGVVAAP